MSSVKLKIYTLGTSTRTMEEFLALLQGPRIKHVIDVRSFPRSKRFPHFDRKNLEYLLPREGLAYFWLGRELGGFRRGGYEAFCNTALFEHGLKKLLAIASLGLSVIICAEKFPWRCHRRYIALALEKLGHEVIHILDPQQFWSGPLLRQQKLMPT